MSSEDSEEASVSVRLPADLRERFDRMADSRGIDRSVLIEELLAAHAALDEDSLDDSPSFVSEQRLEQEADDVRAEFMELLEDVRRRVIQVKREADGKAPDDHTHDELQQITELSAAVEQIETTVAELDAELAGVRDDIDAGFENYESILEYLVDAVDNLDQKTTTLARATVQSRDRLHDVVAAHQRRVAVDELKRAAGQYGIASAACDHCNTSVDISLLTAPECPHCAETFSDLSPKSGLFGKPTLETGEPPALIGSAESELDQELESQLDSTADTTDAADVDWKHRSRDDTE